MGLKNKFEVYYGISHSEELEQCLIEDEICL